MSGGIAYVLDEKHDLYLRVNKQLVSIELLQDREDIEQLQQMISEHTQATGSPLGKRILAQWESHIPRFKKIIPTEYKRMKQLIREKTAQGADAASAKLEAFYELTRA